jgi:hypothetical protein
VTSVDDCRLVELPRVARREGSITPIEGGVDVPFPVARVYYLYDTPGGAARGGHAHRELEQLIVAVMGSFRVALRDGTGERVVELNRAYHGLYLPRMIWRELDSFSSGGICVVLASQPYEERDYIRGYDEYLQAKRNTLAFGD